MDGPEHGRVGVSDESERGQVDTEEEEGRVFPPSGPRLVDVEGHAHPVVSVERGAEVMEPHDGQQRQHDADEPGAAHGRVGSLQSALAEGQRVHDADVAVQRDDAEGQHGHLRGQRAEDAGHVTLAAVTPFLVVQDVLPAELDVLGADHHQVDAHQHVGQAEVLDEEGVDLIVLAQQEAAEEDEDVADAGQHGHHPHAHAQHHVLQQVLPARDAVPPRLALRRVLCVHTQVEPVEISAHRKRNNTAR